MFTRSRLHFVHVIKSLNCILVYSSVYKITFFVHNMSILLYKIFEMFEVHVYTYCVNLIIIISKDLLEVYIYR